VNPDQFDTSAVPPIDLISLVSGIHMGDGPQIIVFLIVGNALLIAAIVAPPGGEIADPPQPGVGRGWRGSAGFRSPVTAATSPDEGRDGLVAASLVGDRASDTAGVRAFDTAHAGRPPTAPLALPGYPCKGPAVASPTSATMLMGRIVPPCLYALLGYEVIASAITSRLSPVNWLTVVGGPVREGLFAAFCLIPCVLFVIRPKAAIHDGRVLPRVVAFLGTAILLLSGTGLGGA